jgi:hypothetical protein
LYRKDISLVIRLFMELWIVDFGRRIYKSKINNPKSKISYCNPQFEKNRGRKITEVFKGNH